jgi:hypothetical protein
MLRRLGSMLAIVLLSGSFAMAAAPEDLTSVRATSTAAAAQRTTAKAWARARARARARAKNKKNKRPVRHRAPKKHVARRTRRVGR